MTVGDRSIVLRHLNTLYSVGMIGDLTRCAVLERFTSRRDETAELAFGALVERHGPMVLSVCRAVLHDAHDADDAFQATFLILVRRHARYGCGTGWDRGSMRSPFALHPVPIERGQAQAIERRAAEMVARPPENGDRDEAWEVIRGGTQRSAAGTSWLASKSPRPQGSSHRRGRRLSRGQTLAYEDDSGTIRLVDADAARNGGRLHCLEPTIPSWSSRRIAGGWPAGGTSGDQVHVAVWDVPGGELRHRWDWPKGRDPHSTVESLCFTPMGADWPPPSSGSRRPTLGPDARPADRTLRTMGYMVFPSAPMARHSLLPAGIR